MKLVFDPQVAKRAWFDPQNAEGWFVNDLLHYGSLTVVTGQATETDLAQAIAHLKAKAIGQVTETDLAQTISVATGIVVFQASETDLAQALTRHKTRALGQPTETDLSQALTHIKIRLLGQPSETDLSQAVTWNPKRRLISQALETDLSQGITWSPKRRLVGQISETDLAQAIAKAKAKLLGQTTETDLAQTVAWAPKRRLVNRASETDLAQPVRWAHIIAVVQSNETDLAQSMAGVKHYVTNQVFEVDTSNDMTVIKTLERLIADLQKPNLGAIVTMYVLDTTSIGGGIERIAPDTNFKQEPIIWQGLTYSPFSIEASGFERSGRGTSPTPTVKVSDIGGVITALCQDMEDLVGAIFTRKRTLTKYLDAVNYVSGINVDANPTQFLPDEIWTINRKTNHFPGFYVEFELASALDFQGRFIPKRQVIANICPWSYRGAECGYAGGAVATVNDVPTGDINLDDCGRRIASCKFRFGENGELPFGGFPGTGLIR